MHSLVVRYVRDGSFILEGKQVLREWDKKNKINQIEWPYAIRQIVKQKLSRSIK